MRLLTNLIFEPKGAHDPALAYSIKDTVMSADGSRVYFALQDVPAGTALTDEDYWMLQIDLSASKSSMDNAIADFADYAKTVGTKVRGETAHATGNPVTFLPDAGSLLQPVTVLEPRQEGSGDPTPENIRPFIGYDELGLNHHVGKNLIDADTDGTFEWGTLYELPPNVNAPELYIKIMTTSGTSQINIGAISADGATNASGTVNVALLASGAANNTWHALKYYIGTETKYLRFYNIDTATARTGIKIMVSVDDVDYVTYQGILHTAQLGETVYGLRYEWLTGKNTKNWGHESLTGDEVWTEQNGVFYSCRASAEGGLSYINVPCYCSHYKNIDYYQGDNFEKYGVNISYNTFRAYVKDRFPTLDSWVAFVKEQYNAGTPVEFVFPYDNPQEILLTPHIISAADPEQTNTLYGDGSIEVEYVKPLYVSIDEKLDDVQISEEQIVGVVDNHLNETLPASVEEAVENYFEENPPATGDVVVDNTALRRMYFGYDFLDSTVMDNTQWYYTASIREGATIGSIVYDCPEAGNTTYGYAMANETGLAKIRNKQINVIRFKLSPNNTATSGIATFAVMPINGNTYSHYIEVSYTASNIENGWVTVLLDEPFTIGQDETFVQYPRDDSHTPPTGRIAILRSSSATTTDEYIDTYYNVPKSWTHSGNYITRLGLCVDLGYCEGTTIKTTYTPNFDTTKLEGGWSVDNMTSQGYAPTIGFSNKVIIRKYYVCDDICTKAHVKLTALDSVLAFGSNVRTDGAGGRSVGSLVKFDFTNKQIVICRKTDGSSESAAYVTVDASSVMAAGQLEYILTVGRINSRVFASVSNYATGATVSKVVEDISVSDFSPVGRFYDYLTFAQISGSQSYWLNLRTYVPSRVKIAFLGDSITQGIYLPTVADSYISQLKTYYGNCVSSGRGGAKADFIIDALDDGLVAAFEPQYVSVTIGTNGNTTLAKLKSIVEKIRAIGAMPIVNCVSQTADGKTTGDEQMIAAVNDMIKQLHVPCARFDIATGTNNDPTAVAPAAVLQDEVHPNSTGHALMAERFKFDMNCLE